MTLNRASSGFLAKKTFNKLSDIYFVTMGFLLCQNIISLFKIGSTSFNLLIILLIPFALYKIAIYRGKIFLIFKRIPKTFYFCVATIILSIIPGLFMIPVLNDISPLFKGIVFYFLSAVLPFFLGLISNKKEKEELFFGLFLGFIMNVLVSVIVYFVFKVFGYTLTFTSLFVNDSFFEPNYFSSVQGLFLEPSHLAGFVLMSFYLLFWFYKNKLIRITLFLGSWILFLLYRLGNLPIFIISQVAFAIIMYGKLLLRFLNKSVFASRKRKIIFYVVLIFAILFIFLLIAFPLRPVFESIFYEFNPFSKANQDRMNSILVGLNVFFKKPFGVGFNLSGLAIDAYYGNDVTTATTHSFFLKLLIEQGVLGVVTFIYLIYSLISIAKRGKNCSLLIISLVCSVLFSFLDGPTEPYLFFLMGIICSIKQLNSSFYFLKKGKKLEKNYYFKINL